MVCIRYLSSQLIVLRQSERVVDRTGQGRGGHPFGVDFILGQTHGAEAETEGEALAEGFLAVVEAAVGGDLD